AGNWAWALAALAKLHPRVAKRLEADEALDSDDKRATALLAAIEKEKGRFAQALTQVRMSGSSWNFGGDPRLTIRR
ncbi:MAG: hypothetical protein LC790_05570, partial [Actinobacteria bacterium]|nr:hypothetical protein [Actinomycetota bacterium]